MLLFLSSLGMGVGVGHWVSSASSELLPDQTNHEKKRASHWVNSRIDFEKVSQMERNNLRLKPIMDKLMRGELPSDWEAELNKILDTATRAEKYQALLVFFSLWAQTDIDAALARASVMGGPYAKAIKKEILKQLIENDPSEAARYYQENKDNLLSNYGYLIGDIARKWVEKSPEKAWAWCMTLDNPDAPFAPQRTALSAFMVGLDVSDSAVVKNYLEKFKQVVGVYHDGTIKNWASQNPDEALSWVTSVSDENHNCLRGVILGVMKTDLKRAEELLKELPPRQQIGMIGQISDDMAYNQGAERALSWVMDKVTPAELAENSFLLYPISPWTNQSPEAASQWVEKLPASPIKDEVIARYADSLYNATFYDKAFELMNTMESAEKKEATLKSVLHEWQNNNQEGFEKWLEQSKNSEELKSLMQNTTPQ